MYYDQWNSELHPSINFGQQHDLHIYTIMYVWMYACKYVCVYVCLPVCMWPYLYAYICVDKHA